MITFYTEECMKWRNTVRYQNSSRTGGDWKMKNTEGIPKFYKLDNAVTENDFLQGFEELIGCNSIVGLFDEILKRPPVTKFVKECLTSFHGRNSEASWLLFLLSYGAISDVPHLTAAGNISPASLTSSVIQKLRKATILEYCLSHYIVDLPILQGALATDENVVSLDTIKELLIELVVDGIVNGKIDEEHERFYVSWV